MSRVLSFSLWFWFQRPVKDGKSGFGGAWPDDLADGPHEAGELTAEGGGGDLGLLMFDGGQMFVAMMQAGLRLPGQIGDGFGEAFLAEAQFAADACGEAVVPGGFDQSSASNGIAHFGDAALLAIIAGGVFAGNQAEVPHELAWMSEALEITEFGDEGGGVEDGQAPQGHQGFDDGFPAPGGDDAGDLGVITGEAVGGFGDDVEHFLEEELLFWERQFDRSQVAKMFGRPGGGAGITEVVAQEKHFELLPGAMLLLVDLEAGANEIADGLVLRIGDMNGGQFAGPVKACELVGITAVGFDAIPGFARDFRGGDDDAVIPMGLEETAQGIAVRSGLVTEAELKVGVGGLQFFGETQDVIVGTADEAVAPDFGGITGGETDGDGIGVDILADEQEFLAGGWGEGLGQELTGGQRGSGLRLDFAHIAA